jgi:hypothetical protein
LPKRDPFEGGANPRRSDDDKAEREQVYPLSKDFFSFVQA